MSKRRRKWTEDESKQPPKKKFKYNPKMNTNERIERENQAPKCTNTLNMNIVDSFQANDAVSSSSDSSSEDESDDTYLQQTRYTRKVVPGLRSSQESILPTSATRTPKPIKLQHRDPRRQRTYRRIMVQRAARNATYCKPFTPSITRPDTNDILSSCNVMDLRRSFSDKGWLFVLIGVALGYFICYSAIWIMETNTASSSSYVQKQYTKHCLCDTTNNETSIGCKQCLDKYWIMNKEYRECMERNEALRDDVNRFETERCDETKRSLMKYKKINKELEDEIANMADPKCVKHLDTIRELQHELGECVVEWGSCEQVGRQKDALDAKRVEEIRKQKQKFSFCKEQLKKYKDKVKKSRGNA